MSVTWETSHEDISILKASLFLNNPLKLVRFEAKHHDPMGQPCFWTTVLLQLLWSEQPSAKNMEMALWSSSLLWKQSNDWATVLFTIAHETIATKRAWHKSFIACEGCFWKYCKYKNKWYDRCNLAKIRIFQRGVWVWLIRLRNHWSFRCHYCYDLRPFRHICIPDCRANNDQVDIDCRESSGWWWKLEHVVPKEGWCVLFCTVSSGVCHYKPSHQPPDLLM